MPHEPSDAALPRPDDAALERSRVLAQRIRDEIDAAGGWIGFERYMHLALYEPRLGYYAADSVKFGTAGDFVTAPELSDALARAASAALSPWLRTLSEPVILELGAGNGTLAAQLLTALRSLGVERVRYSILETSAALRQRQRNALAAFDDVVWLERLPAEPIEGVVLANEVADALPVACFVKRGGCAVPLGVARAGERLEWSEGSPQPGLDAAVKQIESDLGAPLPEAYRSELCSALPAWIGALAASLSRGAVLLVDYGYGRRDYYRTERSGGTLICHYRHRAHDDPFVYPGLQDITAWVDFSACADAAHANGLRVAGYTTQAQFLLSALGAGLLGEREQGGSVEALAALKTLLLPGEMGERFKALLLTKQLDTLELPGRDFRSRL